MSSENLRFSVEESVWFQKGQEVSELISISLDPDIVIQEHDQYVSIRGALQLTGEYRIDENNAEEGERDFASVRLVNEVITREDGISELNHRFPVDITIPQDRVQSLDDVYVLIETFDYEIPKRGCLQIVADLAISGIHGITQASKEEVSTEARKQEEQPSAAVEQPSATVEQPAEEELELVRSSSFEEEEETQVDAEVVSEEDVHVVAEVIQEDQEEGVLQYQEEVVLQSGAEEQEADRKQQDEEADADLFVPFEVEARKEVYLDLEQHEEIEVVDAIEEEEFQTVLTPTIEVKARHDNQLSFASDQPNKKSSTAVQEKEVVQEHREEQTEESVKRSENDLLLTKIFGRDEVDDHTTMKICIVQHGDSLEKISQRYEISVQQLVRVNSLNTDSVSEGQLLYIPVQANT
ncbi:stage VI sporulation protein D [Bacillus timonensis]|uniref:Stage VI sporulation protein D n=1 Tax=Bacillus timonensis TaxID=1033734 RepID=A0A4S3Q008_9BACI|nr:stage VI sporulation protein D [Bacillus timonensis]THE15284.1 stage VI sporulation protein D [Bacillus timonensis]